MNPTFVKPSAVIAMSLWFAALASGCRSYSVQLKCGPRINCLGIDKESKDCRRLDVAVVGLSDKDLDRLDGAVPGLSFPKKKPEAAKAITAVDWWEKGLDRRVRDTLRPGATWENTLDFDAAGKDLTVKITPAGSFGKRGGIVVLARYFGYNEAKPDSSLRTEVFISGREASRTINIEVGEHGIRKP